MKLRLTPREGFTLIELLVVISIIAILAGIAVPAFTGVIERGNQTKDLSNAKQIYLGLKLYGTDNDGKFPNIPWTADNTGTGEIENSNQAFQHVVPDYIKSEKIFYLAKSAWTPKAPDENIASGKALEGGENQFAYVTNLTDTSNPNFPLIADGFGATPGVYATDETAKGGVWKGKAAVVIRVDGSGKVEKVKSTDQKVYGQTGQTGDKDIFATVDDGTWLSSTGKQVPVNPAEPTVAAP